MSTPRQDAIKGYIICLLNDGALRGSRAPATIAAKAIAEFSSDVWTAAGELAGMAAESGARNLAEKAPDIARDLIERGMSALAKKWAPRR